MCLAERPNRARLHLLLLLSLLLHYLPPSHAFFPSPTSRPHTLCHSALSPSSRAAAVAAAVNRVEDVEALLAAQIYPHQTADARKTLAFEAQDSFLLQHSTQVDDKKALTKKYTTYGEFPLASLHAILQRLNLGPDDVFLDLGSGSGRLVLGTALQFPHLKACYGVEVVPELHGMAVEARKKAGMMEDRPEMSPCRFVQGNVETGEYLRGEEEEGSEEGREGRQSRW